jgi:hypothetical protein
MQTGVPTIAPQPIQTKSILTWGQTRGIRRVNQCAPMNLTLVVSFEHQNGTGMARTLCHITVTVDSRSKASNLHPERVWTLIISRFSIVILQPHHAHSRIVSFHIFLGSSFNHPIILML